MFGGGCSCSPCPQPVPTKQGCTAAGAAGNPSLSAQTFYYPELSRMRAWKILLCLQNSWKKCKGRSESSGAYGEKDPSCAFPENQHHFQQGTAAGLGWQWSHCLGGVLPSNAHFSLQSCVVTFDHIPDQTLWNWGNLTIAGICVGRFWHFCWCSLFCQQSSCSGRGTLWEIMHTKKSSLEVQPEGFPVIWIPMQKYSTWRKHMEEKQLFENLNSIN